MLQVVLAAPGELRKAELERGIIVGRDLEDLHAGAHDLGAYTVAPDDPDLDHWFMLATGRGSYQALDFSSLAERLMAHRALDLRALR